MNGVAIFKKDIYPSWLKKILMSMEEVIMRFEEIYPKYKRFINSLLFKYPGIEEFADMEQDILLTIARKCEGILNPKLIKVWLASVIRNYAFDKLRSKRRKAQCISFSEIEVDPEFQERFEPENMLVEEKDPSIILENKELKIRIRKIINKLKNPWRKVLIARHYKNLSYDEIAKKHDINPGTVKSRIARARERFIKKFHEKE